MFSTSYYTLNVFLFRHQTVAKFLVPDCGDKVDYGIGLLYQPVRPCTYAGGPVRQPFAILGYIPQSGTKNLASGQTVTKHRSDILPHTYES